MKPLNVMRMIRITPRIREGIRDEPSLRFHSRRSPKATKILATTSHMRRAMKRWIRTWLYSRKAATWDARWRMRFTSCALVACKPFKRDFSDRGRSRKHAVRDSQIASFSQLVGPDDRELACAAAMERAEILEERLGAPAAIPSRGSLKRGSTEKSERLGDPSHGGVQGTGVAFVMKLPAVLSATVVVKPSHYRQLASPPGPSPLYTVRRGAAGTLLRPLPLARSNLA